MSNGTEKRNKIEFLHYTPNKLVSLSMNSKNQISLPINHYIHDMDGNTPALTSDGTASQLVAGKTYMLMKQDELGVIAVYCPEVEGQCDGTPPDCEHVLVITQARCDASLSID